MGAARLARRETEAQEGRPKPWGRGEGERASAVGMVGGGYQQAFHM